MVTVPGLQLVLAEGITSEQLKQLAAVMLGLVVFAAVFVLVERQRIRRGGQEEHTEAPMVDDPVAPTPVEYPPWTPPPQHAGAGTGLQPIPDEGELQDELPVRFVPRSHEPAGAAYPPASTQPDAATGAPANAARAAAPEATAPEARPSRSEPSRSEPVERQPTEQPPGQRTDESSPETPDDIGIIIPEEPPQSGSETRPKPGPR